MGKKLVKREVRGKGFTYRYASTGRVLRDIRLKSWIKKLAIPPAWTEVHIDLEKDAKIHAWGRDAKRRKQYIYNAQWRLQRNQTKFERILQFAAALPAMRRITAKHLQLEGPRRDKVLACMVRLIENAHFRPGSSYYTEENESYGLTTLRSRHLTISGTQLEFDYIGKAGMHQHKVVDQPELVAIVRQIDQLPGYEIFKYIDAQGDKIQVTPALLNDYLHEVMGEQFSVKDFRTWSATYLAAMQLAEVGTAQTTSQVKRNVIAAIDFVAEKLGNTRAVVRSNYIDPMVIESYRNGVTVNKYLAKRVKSSKRHKYLSVDEQAVIQLLKTT